MMLTRQEVIRNFIQSLEKERASLGFTQAQMAQKMEMSLSGYKKLIAGETAKIDIYLAYRVCSLTGKWFYELCRDEHSPYYDIMNKVRALTASQLRFISGIIDFEIQFHNKVRDGIEDYVSILIPTGDEKDGMILDSANIEKLNVAPYRKWFGSELHCAIKITSDHLAPAYHMGDVLLISNTAPRDGDTGIFINRDNGRAYLRKYRQTDPAMLEPIVGYGRTFVIDSRDHKEVDKWIKFGRVLSKIRDD